MNMGAYFEITKFIKFTSFLNHSSDVHINPYKLFYKEKGVLVKN